FVIHTTRCGTFRKTRPYSTEIQPHEVPSFSDQRAHLVFVSLVRRVYRHLVTSLSKDPTFSFLSPSASEVLLSLSSAASSLSAFVSQSVSSSCLCLCGRLLPNTRKILLTAAHPAVGFSQFIPRFSVLLHALKDGGFKRFKDHQLLFCPERSFTKPRVGLRVTAGIHCEVLCCQGSLRSIRFSYYPRRA
ncbi:hypothetical protein CSUI_004676, partial [Cystoisospora suis]